MKNRVRLIVLSLVLLALAMQTVSGLQINDNESATIGVTVASQTWVDVNPAALSWTGINPGGTGGQSEEAGGFYAIQIENVGSENLTHVWFNTSVPSSRPFGTGLASNYDAGNFIVIAREGNGTFLFPNRLEFNESKTLVYLKDPGGSMPPDDSSYKYGRFRNASKEYFWFAEPDTSGDCNSSSATFYMGRIPHTKEQTGTVDFSSCSGTLVQEGGTGCGSGSLTQSTTDPEWGYVDVSVNGSDYTVAVSQDCSRVYFTSWNKDGVGAEDGSAAKYFSASTLMPGESLIAEMKVYVPYGVAVGSVSQGLLNVVVNNV